MNLLDRAQPNRSWFACCLSFLSVTGKLLPLVRPSWCRCKYKYLTSSTVASVHARTNTLLHQLWQVCMHVQTPYFINCGKCACTYKHLTSSTVASVHARTNTLLHQLWQVCMHVQTPYFINCGKCACTYKHLTSSTVASVHARTNTLLHQLWQVCMHVQTPYFNCSRCKRSK